MVRMAVWPHLLYVFREFHGVVLKRSRYYFVSNLKASSRNHLCNFQVSWGYFYIYENGWDSWHCLNRHWWYWKVASVVKYFFMQYANIEIHSLLLIIPWVSFRSGVDDPFYYWNSNLYQHYKTYCPYLSAPLPLVYSPRCHRYFQPSAKVIFSPMPMAYSPWSHDYIHQSAKAIGALVYEPQSHSQIYPSDTDIFSAMPRLYSQ